MGSLCSSLENLRVSFKGHSQWAASPPNFRAFLSCIYRTCTVSNLCSSLWTQRAWFYGICTVDSICSSFQINRAGYMEYALWAASAPPLETLRVSSKGSA